MNRRSISSISVIERKIILGALDLVATVSGVVFAAWVVGHSFPVSSKSVMAVLGVLVVRFGVYIESGLYDLIWKYASLFEFKRIFRSTIVGTLLIVLGRTVIGYPNLTYRTLIVEALVNISVVSGIRFSLRLYRDFLIQKQRRRDGLQTRQSAIIIGAGDAGNLIVKELINNPKSIYSVVGFLDDAPSKLGKMIHGFSVLGTVADLERVVSEFDINTAIIAIPSASGDQIRHVVDRCESVGLLPKITPTLSDLVSGRASLSQVRSVAIDDLLGRDTNELDLSTISAYLTGARVMITGAGGSIGSELARQIGMFSPSSIVLLDHAETSLYHIDMEIRNRAMSAAVYAIVADVKDLDRMTQVFAATAPTIVFHAAAYKHVPMMEDNVEEAILNNVLGTRNMLELSGQSGVREFVLISTDKAVRPTNVMGATKRLCEVLFKIASDRFPRTRFAAVRFGNVLGSQGSVIPLFRQQIESGGPITITHPEVTRYFMTIPEAIRLIIQAGALARGGELFILDMGEPVKIVNLARDLIRLSGLNYTDIPIRFTGLRPGEKLYEELYFDTQCLRDTPNKKIFVSDPTIEDVPDLEAQITLLIESCFRIPAGQLKSMLMALAHQSSPAMNPVDSPTKVTP